MAEGRSIPKNISFYEKDLATLHQVGKDMGLTSLSAAIRYVIHDWKKMQSQQGILAESRTQYITEQS